MATAKTKPSNPKKTTSPKSTPSKTKKTPVKAQLKSAVKPSVVKDIAPVTGSSSVTSSSGLKVRRLYLVIALILIAGVGLAVYFRSLFVVAIVNGQPISRLDYIRETESVYLQIQQVTAGKQALNQLVTKALLYQEAKRRNITVSEKEVNSQIENSRKLLQKKNQKLEDALALQGDSLAGYEDRLRTQNLIQQLLGKVTVSDKEVTEYIQQNQATLQELPEAEQKTQAKDALLSQKSNEKLQTLIQGLQQKAKVTYLIK